MNKFITSRIYRKTLLSLFSVLLLFIFAGVLFVQNKMNTEKLEMENLIIEKSTQISDSVFKLLYKTEVLSALIIQGNGDIDNFDLMAQTIMDDPSILNVLIAPNGIVSKAYPQASAESLVGLNFFDENEWAGNREALLARDTGQLVLAGPFVVTSGDLAITGRKPVYITQGEEQALWGLVSVTLKFPDALSDAKLDDLHLHGVDYEIWRINPDDGEKQVIAGSGYADMRRTNWMRNVRFTEMPISIQNAHWYFRIFSAHKWYGYLELWLFVIGGLGISFLAAFIMQKNTEIQILHQAAEEQNKTIMAGITYASKIQRSLQPPDDAMANAFSDHSCLWEPRDIVGGDIYWMKQFDKGTVLCVADCTGHGTPGALLTMLVMSALESIVFQGNCDDTAGIVWQLDQRLSEVLHAKSDDSIKRGIMDIDDGCDLAVLFIAKDGSVQFSSGNIPVFICDGKEVIQHKGQKIFVGEGKIKSKDEVIINSVPANPGNKFYIASDGLFDQKGSGAGKQFGYTVFKQIIFDNHHEKQSIITGKVWKAFEEFRGNEVRRDDFELIAFKP